jgi:hypothetical protein
MSRVVKKGDVCISCLLAELLDSTPERPLVSVGQDLYIRLLKADGEQRLAHGANVLHRVA